MVNHNTISENKILCAAKMVFTAEGFTGARMQTIAREAGVNKALLHYYFRSKEKLYQAVLKQIITQVWETIRREMGTNEKAQGMEEIIRTVVSAYIRTLKDNPDFPSIMLHEISSGGKNIPVVLGELMENFKDVFSRIMAGAAQGRLKPMEPVQIIMNLIGMVIATFLAKPFAPAIYRRIFQKELVMDDAFYEERIRAVTETLCRGILMKETP